MSLEQLADRIDATVLGDPAVQITGCAPIDQAGPHDVTFVANSKYQKFLDTTRAAAVIVDVEASCPAHISRLIADDPYFAFRNAVVALEGHHALIGACVEDRRRAHAVHLPTVMV